MTTGPDIPALLGAPPGTFLTGDQARRATCLGLALVLLRGRSAPIQVVERIARWIYNGEEFRDRD